VVSYYTGAEDAGKGSRRSTVEGQRAEAPTWSGIFDSQKKEEALTRRTVENKEGTEFTEKRKGKRRKQMPTRKMREGSGDGD
jgi:hypothetical protein